MRGSGFLSCREDSSAPQTPQRAQVPLCWPCAQWWPSSESYVRFPAELGCYDPVTAAGDGTLRTRKSREVPGEQWALAGPREQGQAGPFHTSLRSPASLALGPWSCGHVKGTAEGQVGA